MSRGGGSTQIAFAVDPAKLTAQEKAAFGDKLHSYSLSGVQYSVYAHSYLGYGLNSARAAILDSDKARADAVGHPCLPVGFTKKGKDAVSAIKGRAEASPGECQAWVDEFIATAKAEKVPLSLSLFAAEPTPLYPCRMGLLLGRLCCGWLTTRGGVQNLCT